MELKKALGVFFIFCALPTFGTTSEEYAEIGEKIIKKEIERFHPFKDKIFAEQVDVVVEFSYSKLNEDDSVTLSESFQLRPLAPPKPTLGSDSDTFTRDNLKLIFDLAKKVNISAAASREKFDKSGILLSKTIYADGVKIHYEDGNSEIKLREDPTDDMGDEDEVEDVVGIMKEFEMPVEAEISLYDKSGKLIKTEKDSYAPKKVKIESTNGMTVDMQMKIAEALKRSCVMKETGTDRIKLLVRYLGIQFPEYDFYAAIGNGSHSVINDINVTIVFDGDVYFIWATNKTQEEEEEE